MSTRIPQYPPHIAPYTASSRPLWSVMIPVYNCIQYIPEVLRSVLQQAPNEELMQIEVIDDCSTDGDVKKLVADLGNGRIGYFKQRQNSGSLRNFETCINRSRGEYVHILHGDDMVELGFYKEIGSLLSKYPDAGAAFTNFRYIDHNSRVLPIINISLLKSPGIIPDFIEKIGTKQLIQPPAMVVRRSTYEKIGSFFAVHFGEDWEMWVRIGSQFSVAYSPKYLASYRVGHGMGISHESYRTGQNIIDMRKVINIIQPYLPEDQRARLKKRALAYYAKYAIRIANGLLLNNPKAAFRQIKGAWQMDRSFNTICWIIRFYAMYGLRYKQLEDLWRRRRKNIFEDIVKNPR